MWSSESKERVLVSFKKIHSIQLIYFYRSNWVNVLLKLRKLDELQGITNHKQMSWSILNLFSCVGVGKCHVFVISVVFVRIKKNLYNH